MPYANPEARSIWNKKYRKTEKAKQGRLRYQRANKDKVRLWNQKYNSTEDAKKANRERQLSYYHADRQKFIQRKILWFKRHPDVQRAASKRYYWNHKDEIIRRNQSEASSPHGRMRINTAYLRSKLRSYGVDDAWLAEQLIKQCGRCAICGSCGDRNKSGKWLGLSIDHDHRTMKARGLLCVKCNTSLRSGEDDISWFQKAETYLRRCDGSS